MKNTAVISGSFDPITSGHTDLIRRALEIFPKVIVAVCDNSEKKYMFSQSVRLEAVKASVRQFEGVEVVCLDGLLAEFVKSVDGVLVKGARNGVDFDYEKNLFDINYELSGVETVVFPASVEFQFVSSTFVRELIKYNRLLDGYVPKEAIPYLK